MADSLELLEWYVTAGADEALQDTPRDYFSAAEPSPVSTPVAPTELFASPAPQALPKIPAALPLHQTPPAAIVEAKRLADAAGTLEQLEAAVRSFDGCTIKRTATHTVFADGNPQARLMLIGEAPGAQEDAQGIPFCGPSGQLLDKMLAAIGYDRTTAYITNTVYWRPPGNRQPNSEELAICQPFVLRHIALIDPALIVLVGGTATKAVLGTEQGITRLRGKAYAMRTPYRDKEYPVAIIYHPSYLLRQPLHKRAAWQDLLAIRSQMRVAG